MREEVQSVRNQVAEVGLKYFCLDYVSKNGVSVTEHNTEANPKVSEMEAKFWRVMEHWGTNHDRQHMLACVSPICFAGV